MALTNIFREYFLSTDKIYWQYDLKHDLIESNPCKNIIRLLDYYTSSILQFVLSIEVISLDLFFY